MSQRLVIQGRSGLRGRSGFQGRSGLLPLLVALLVWFSSCALALASGGLLPSGFFDHQAPAPSAKASVTADFLTFDQTTKRIIADGQVVFKYNGYSVSGDHLIFYQGKNSAHMTGNVIIHDPTGIIYTTPDLTLTDGMRHALLTALTIRTPTGALVTADSGDYATAAQSVLTNATYAPCGKCIGKNGATIGWRVKATRVIRHNESGTVTLEQPVLYLLGVPMAWLPWLTLPDPTKPRQSGFRMPSLDSSEQMGAAVSVPYFYAADENTDLIFTPTLMSRQGFRMGAQWNRRFANGSFTVKGSGVYQLDPAAFARTVGDRRWRGAIQTSGEFVPAKDWTVGWSYTAFTDAAYLSDYHERDPNSKDLTNEVYATRLTRNDYFDVRAQQSNQLSTYKDEKAQDEAQNRQAQTLPNARYDRVIPLAGGNGEIDLSARLLGLHRGLGDTPDSTPYVLSHGENKVHAMVQAGWQKQWIGGNGIVATPYLGMRADAAYADYTDLPGATANEVTLYNATPIAALDIRYPMIARTGDFTHLIEPIAQVVYRASSVTDTGIINDDAHSLVFDDTNLFSYNRFSGIDRQETGLRANLGANYQLTYGNDHWINFIGGQSFHLAGDNAFASPGDTQTGTGEGLDTSASYLVLGATASPITGLSLGGKLQLDPAVMKVTRAGVAGTYATNGYAFDASYLYIGADHDRGVVADQQEVSASASVPLIDYWSATAGASWDLSANQYLEAHAGLQYDDGYLVYGGNISRTGPTNTNPDDLRYTFNLLLKGPTGATY